MKILLIILSGVLLVSNEKNIDKTQLEAITKTKVVEQYKIIPKEIIKQKMAENMQKQVVAKKTTTKKKKAKKKVVKKIKKKVVNKKTTKKKTYKQKTRIKYNVGEIQAYAHQLVREYGWSEEDYQLLVLLWYRESSWNPNAVNKKSGACGLGQAYPCSKATEGTDYRTNWKTQVHWGLNYIRNRYGNPRGAWEHSQQIGWY